MINLFAKSLVMLHTILSLMGMAWALMIFFQGRDVGFWSPELEVLETNADGVVTKGRLIASEYDKSSAALAEAAQTRDRTYARVKPAVDALRAAEPFLANNHLFYQYELNRLRNAKGPIEVRHLQKVGTVYESPLGKPKADAAPIDLIKKSYTEYEKDLYALIGQTDDPKTGKKRKGKIDLVNEDIRTIAEDSKEFSFQLTGKNDENKYVQPGLNQMLENEFTAQLKIREEIDGMKKAWASEVEKAKQFRERHDDLVRQRDTLLKDAPPALKDNKKKQ